MKHGGNREGAGHPRFSSEFLEWVHTNVANEIQSRTHIWFMARTKSNVGMQRIKDEIAAHSQTDEDSFDSIPQPDGSFEIDKLNKELRAEQRLFVAQQWKLGKSGSEIFNENGPFGVPPVEAIIIQGPAPKPTAKEMSAVYQHVASLGTSHGYTCDAKTIKRAWHKARSIAKYYENIITDNDDET